MYNKLGRNFVSALMGGRQELGRFLESFAGQSIEADTVLSELFTKGITYCYQPIVGSRQQNTVVFGERQIYKAGFPEKSAYLEATDPLDVFGKKTLMIPVSGCIVTISAGKRIPLTSLRASWNHQSNSETQLTQAQFGRIFYSPHEVTWH